MNRKLFYLWFLLSLFTSSFLFSQKQEVMIYLFDGNFNESSGKLTSLTVLGSQGQFVEEQVKSLNYQKKKVYQFEKNCGLAFDNRAAGNFLKDAYSIEIYFRFDALDSWKRVIDFKNRQTDNGCYIFNGKLNFYNIVVGAVAPVQAGAYTHYIITRDAVSQKVQIYANGISKVEFVDSKQDAVLDANQTLHFFYDDLVKANEASSGAVAMIKIYNYVITNEQAKQAYTDLKENIKKTTSDQQNKVTLEGQVKDEKTNKVLKAAITITGKNFSEKINTNEAGLFSISLINPATYSIQIKATNYMHLEETVAINSSTKIEKIFLLQQLKTGATFNLKNVYFEQSKDKLLIESYKELDKVVSIMQEYPAMEIFLSGYTDNQGVAKANLQLSEKRVQVVIDYLISKKIDKKRVKGKGFGGEKPIINNATTEEQRKLNRRVELTITKL